MSRPPYVQYEMPWSKPFAIDTGLQRDRPATSVERRACHSGGKGCSRGSHPVHGEFLIPEQLFDSCACPVVAYPTWLSPDATDCEDDYYF